MRTVNIIVIGLAFVAICRAIPVATGDNDSRPVDPDHAGSLIVHGAHCYHVFQHSVTNGGSDEKNAVHNGHCTDFVASILQYFQARPGYKVDDWICEAFLAEKGKMAQNLDPDPWSVWYTSAWWIEKLKQLSTNPDTLTEAEIVYWAKWSDQTAINMGAIGLYCTVNGDLQTAQRLMETAKAKP